uniref:6-phosphogluconate dehydrogenase NADP-binding domain-containing protein n=2 Tax=Eukaryota TaxID=2759 RepID=A0A6U1E969_9CHLO|mmetsp:Transcript_14835/g.26248  ORF Transcript_14835/g.26248 Transcript_14835/m.26248 type:complete len:292 (+) Transcript_14835:166-1041(+)
MAELTVGYLGMGIMGSAMARNLLKSGAFKDVYVWNRSADKCSELVAEGAKTAGSAAEVVQACDITFACLSDPAAALACVESTGGVLDGISSGKAYVDVSTVDEACSKRICELVTGKGGVFLEAPVSGSKKPAIDGQLIFLCGGDEALYNRCLPAFEIMGKKSFFFGATGLGARMKLVVNMIMGSMMSAFSEGMSLADKSGLKQEQLLEVLSLGAMNNPLFNMKGPGVIAHNYPPAFPLKHQQKDMRLALALGDDVDQPLPVAAAANEAYKAAKAAGLGDNDMSAVHEAIRR